MEEKNKGQSPDDLKRFRYNAEVLKHLSNTENVSLVLLLPNLRGCAEEICLDGRKEGMFSALGLVK